MEFFDKLTLDAPRKTSGGFLVASVKAARTGIQYYSGPEVDPQNEHGMRDRARVAVYRPDSEVFSADSLASYAHKPVTINHPPEAVTADNWSKYAKGQVGGEVLRDGEFVRIPMVIMDATAIRTVEAGQREISQGYTCDLDWTPGTAPDGTMFDCQQKAIRANHTAIVDAARGGPELKIGDNAMPKTIMIDGHSVEMTDAGAILVEGLQAKLATSDAALKAASTELGTVKATLATRDGENAALKTQLADAAMTPAKMDAAIASRAKVVDAAKRIFPTIVVDGKTETEIRKMAVEAKLGDSAKGLNDDAISGAFTTLAAGVIQTNDTLALGLPTIVPTANLADGAKKAEEARNKMIADMQNPNATKAA